MAGTKDKGNKEVPNGLVALARIHVLRFDIYFHVVYERAFHLLGHQDQHTHSIMEVSFTAKTSEPDAPTFGTLRRLASFLAGEMR